MSLLIVFTVIYATVLMLVAYGGMISERSGVINIGLEGIMVMGALAGALVMSIYPPDTPMLILIVIAASALAGALCSLLIAVASITFNANQTLVGTAVNMLATALAPVIARSVNDAYNPGNVSTTVAFVESREILYVGDAGISIFSIIALAVMIILFIVINKTVFGLRLVSCGEHPYAAASVGISVRKMRYAGVIISGILGGIGGIAYITASVNEWEFSDGVVGFGFLALAVMIFGQWNTFKIAIAALIFGALRALSNVYTGFEFLDSLGLPSEFYNILPYAICLLVLVFFSGGSSAPKSAGVPYGNEDEV